MNSDNKSILDALNAKQAFIGGIVFGLLILCTLGFFILLGSFMSGDKTADSYVAPTPTKQDNGNAAPLPTGEIALNPVTEDDHIRGNKDAKVTIVEFSDFECPFCNRFHDTMKQVLQNYPDDVRWVYRHFPLDSLHVNARGLSNASECAGEQGKFWEYADEIFNTYKQGGKLTQSSFESVAQKVGVSDINKFNTCVSDDKYAQDVVTDENDGKGAGAQGTPYSIIIGPDGEMAAINGAQPFSAVQSAVEQMLQ